MNKIELIQHVIDNNIDLIKSKIQIIGHSRSFREDHYIFIKEVVSTDDKHCHPAEILREEFCANYKELREKVPIFFKDRLDDIVLGYLEDGEVSYHDLTFDDALKLSNALGTSIEFWLNLQHEYNLKRAKEIKDLE
jgi:plasmid maintenance system antidote protein VapI